MDSVDMFKSLRDSGYSVNAAIDIVLACLTLETAE